jgi:signal transduction histidine kinase
VKSIQRHLTIRLVLTVLTLAAASGALLYLSARAQLTAEFDRTLMTHARMVAGVVKNDGEGGVEFNAAEASADDSADGPNAIFFEIWRGDGSLLARSPSLRGRDLPREQLTAGKPRYRNVHLAAEDRGRAVQMTFTPAPEEDDERAKHKGRASKAAPDGTIVLARSRRDLDSTLRVLASSLLLAAAALAIGTAVAVAATVRRGLRPLHRLGREADAIGAAASLNHRFSSSKLPKELQPIYDRLNKLLERLEETFARERRFTSDVAHELRTPIAELRSLAEVALKWPDNATAEQNYRDTLGAASRMQSLVNSLLAIARCEAGVASSNASPVLLDEVLQDVWKPRAAAASARQLHADWDIHPGAVVRSDRVMLEALMENLVSNAVDYTPAGGRIAFRISIDSGGTTLAITNTCKGLELADLPHLAEPFWRKDAARTGGLHCGLGLSLVAAYARAIGARLDLNLPAPDEFSASVYFAG